MCVCACVDLCEKMFSRQSNTSAKAAKRQNITTYHSLNRSNLIRLDAHHNLSNRFKPTFILTSLRTIPVNVSFSHFFLSPNLSHSLACPILFAWAEFLPTSYFLLLFFPMYIANNSVENLVQYWNTQCVYVSVSTMEWTCVCTQLRMKQHRMTRAKINFHNNIILYSTYYLVYRVHMWIEATCLL